MWNKNVRIKWEDFMGTPITSENQGSEILIQSSYAVKKMHILLPSEIKFGCYMDRKNSWVNPKAKSETLLIYNQTIFNMYELNNRKILQQLKSPENQKVDPSQIVNTLFSNYQDSLYNSIKIIRTETKMGVDRKAVDKWFLFTIQQLDLYKEY